MGRQVLSKSFICVFVFLAGCAKEQVDITSKTAEVVYDEAYALLEKEEFEDAAKKFKDIETYFPYAEKSAVSQVMSAYCNFRAGSYLDAVRELDIFLRYHPSHELVPYALYLKATSLYMRTASVGRDSKQASEAKLAFVELINRFPTSKYVDDSVKKIIILDDIIAAHEIMIGRYYQHNKNNLAAIMRYNNVVSKFPHAKCVEEAYARIVECCKAEGLKEEAERAMESLRMSFPDGEWLKILKR